MKSAFGSKRKARKIQTDDDDDEMVDANSIPEPVVTKPATGKKAFKKSTLRQSIVFNDASVDGSASSSVEKSDQPPLPDEAPPPPLPSDSAPPARPVMGRVDPLKRKKRPGSSSRLSFGPGEIISGDAAEALEDDPIFTPKKATLGRRAIESNAARQSLPSYSIPIRNWDEDEERPMYSKDYLKELKSSTPNTPKDLRALSGQVEDEGGLDAAELEGAMIVDMDNDAAIIPTDAEIREKKERRARLAKEKDFISLEGGNSDTDNRYSLLPRKRTTESRLVREDEDMAEGFDEFVNDGGISLGRKAEREAKKRQRKEMASLINEAEGSESDASDDSEAERRAAYEVAQTRAGMDGLHKDQKEQQATQLPPRITPLPNLNECLQRLQSTLSGMELELKKRQRKMEELKSEKEGILKREIEVQRLLKEAGDRYSAMRAEHGMEAVNTDRLMENPNPAADPILAEHRGLESFGNTPVGRQVVDDMG